MDDTDKSDDFSASAASIEVEVAYALPEKQTLISLSVKQGTTALAAVLASGLTSRYPAIKLNDVNMGIFSKPLDGKHLPLPEDYILEHKDRVEIYRPLLIDPKQARLQRAQRKETAKKVRAEKAKEAKTGLNKKKRSTEP
ncbi:RnfH family protein [Haliea sp. AH-315-K21]|uniref:UPF0125 protein COA71_05040 n=1 Tax=SAR86 cluster bacterium TaxID=2030880 RepID=A0A2A5CH92_9GAMM|nr:RnfH family protein [Haliea sp. AH-315-K21]MBN4076009.1 RnfH family protein [Gammaproteobacteria bacterium AH-315-E17]PCJ42865.1 MAG: RnfH family protein [SAR86 cluster bacterium]